MQRVEYVVHANYEYETMQVQHITEETPERKNKVMVRSTFATPLATFTTIVFLPTTN